MSCYRVERPVQNLMLMVSLPYSGMTMNYRGRKYLWEIRGRDLVVSAYQLNLSGVCADGLVSAMFLF